MPRLACLLVAPARAGSARGRARRRAAAAALVLAGGAALVPAAGDAASGRAPSAPVVARAAVPAPAAAVEAGGDVDPPPVAPLPPASPFAPPRPLGPAPAPGPAPVVAPAAAPLARYGLPRHGLLRGLSDPVTFVPGRGSLAGFGVARRAGAAVVRISTFWREIEPGAAPAEPTDPADPAYDFTALDASVRAAAAAGLQPLLVVAFAPAHAEAPSRWPYALPGTWAPDPAKLGAFAAALARRYDGAFADPLRPGATLPRVRRFQAWNEPNLPSFLQPQWVVRGGRWVPYAPLRYRAMLDAFTAAVHGVEPADRVAMAGLAPIGEQEDGAGRMAPVRFARALLCLPARSGGAPPPCPNPASFDAFAFHPLSVRAPGHPAAQPLNVAISDLGKLLAPLREARRTGRLAPGAGRALWITELNWDSDPPNPQGATAAQVQRWCSEGLYRLWRAGATLVDWELLRDPLPGSDGAASHPAGLYRPDPAAPATLARDTPKPALRAFRLPFVAERLGRDEVRVWALLAAGRQAVVERRRHGVWTRAARVRAGADGVLLRTVRLRGAARLRLRSGGALVSSSADVPARRAVLR